MHIFQSNKNFISVKIGNFILATIFAGFTCCDYASAQNPEPTELTQLRNAYESKIAQTIDPLANLYIQFEAALTRIRTANPDAATQQAVNGALSSLQQGKRLSISTHPEVERFRAILQQQEDMLLQRNLVGWKELTASHRKAVEQIKVKLGTQAARDLTESLNQELRWLDAEEAQLTQSKIPWQPGTMWREIIHTMEWRGKIPMQESGGALTLRAQSNEEPRLMSQQTIVTPFEMEVLLTPDHNEFKFYLNYCRVIFNLLREPSNSNFVDLAGGNKHYKAENKSLKPSVEQRISVKVQPSQVDILTDDAPFHSAPVEYTGGQFRIQLGPANGAATVVKSVRFRRPNSIHRPSPPDVRTPVLGASMQIATGSNISTGTSSGPSLPGNPPTSTSTTTTTTTTAAGSTSTQNTPPPPMPPRPEADTVWPRVVALDVLPEVTIVEEDVTNKRFVYRTANYEFICDSRLGTNVVKEFSRIFEATYLVNCKLPLDLKPKPETLKKLFTAQLYTTKESYISAGGVRGSAGVYKGGEKKIMVPLSSLGVKMVGSRVSLDYKDQDHYTLIHEITHQMMNHWLRKMPTWLTEGSADFISWAGYDNGRFNFGQTKRLIPEKLLRRGIQADAANVVELSKLMTMDGRTWNAQVTSGNAGANYATAALLTYFFYVLDDKKDGAHMIAFFRAVESGTPTQQAVDTHLMRGRTYEQLEQEMQSAFRSEGVKLFFH